MSMIKKLTKHGNSHALLIDRPIMELLDITEDTPLKITTDGHTLTVSPIRNEAERRKLFEMALADTNKRFGSTLKKLADR